MNAYSNIEEKTCTPCFMGGNVFFKFKISRKTVFLTLILYRAWKQSNINQCPCKWIRIRENVFNQYRIQTVIFMQKLITGGEGSIYLHVLNHWAFLNADCLLLPSEVLLCYTVMKYIKRRCIVTGNCIHGREKNPEFDS